MNKHCKGCINHWNAGHPKTSPNARTYNDWCVPGASHAPKAIGGCKLNNMKRVANGK